MSRHRRQELAGAGSASYRPAAAWIQPLVAAGSLLALLLASGCPKINLQVRASNAQMLAFYESLGYRDDQVVSMGKRLIPDL